MLLCLLNGVFLVFVFGAGAWFFVVGLADGLAGWLRKGSSPLYLAREIMFVRVLSCLYRLGWFSLCLSYRCCSWCCGTSFNYCCWCFILWIYCLLFCCLHFIITFCSLFVFFSCLISCQLSFPWGF